MKFLDEAKIFIKSGDGGAGALAFRHEKFLEFGGPSGGDGGKGGNVYVECLNNLNTLIDYRYQQHFKAERGQNGMGSSRHGKNGKSVTLKVPVGTAISDDDDYLICDMMNENETFLLLRGGDGGFGNEHYKTSVNRAPRRADSGYPGEEKWIRLRLKLIADIGIVGLPNAGKSTFLNVVSNAKPKIADYPFTTLIPQLGVVKAYNKEFVITDLPGLIHEASLGRGLGHKFLKHTERCKMLLHLVDASVEFPLQNYKMIRNELTEYSSLLPEKTEIVALNKCDIIDSEKLSEIKNEFENFTKKNIYIISAYSGHGVSSVIQEIMKNL